MLDHELQVSLQCKVFKTKETSVRGFCREIEEVFARGRRCGNVIGWVC
jgi:hypothetical protein